MSITMETFNVSDANLRGFRCSSQDFHKHFSSTNCLPRSKIYSFDDRLVFFIIDYSLGLFFHSWDWRCFRREHKLSRRIRLNLKRKIRRWARRSLLGKFYHSPSCYFLPRTRLYSFHIYKPTIFSTFQFTTEKNLLRAAYE